MGKQRKGWLLTEAMNEWKLTGESNYAPVNAFPARNLRKGGHLGGNWIVAYNEEQQPRLERLLTTPELTPRVEKILHLNGLLRRHGKTDVNFLTNAKLAGQRYTSIKRTGWDALKLFSLDLTENLLNLDDIEVLSHDLELLELAFNEIRQVKIHNIDSYNTLQYLDLSWNYISGDSLPMLGKLKNVRMLNLSSNRIDEFEIDYDDFPNLFHLKMKSNRLKSGCFHQFKKIESLQELYLNDNQIQQIPLLGDDQSHIALSNLRLLDLSDNPIREEAKLVPAASFPSLQKLFILRTQIVRTTKGDPPLLKEYLTNRIGIELKRTEDNELYTKRSPLMQHSIKIDDKIPKVVRSTVDERIKNYRAELAIETKMKQAIEAGEDTPVLSVNTEQSTDVRDAAFNDTFFITQEMTDEKVTFEEELEKMTNTIKKTVEQESTTVAAISDTLLELSPDEQEEYDNTIKPIPVQSAVNQLRRLLVHDGPRVHKTRAHRLTIQPNPEPYRSRKSDTNGTIVSTHKVNSTKNIIKENLARLRERETLTIDQMDDLLKSSNLAERKEAEELFLRIQDTFRSVRLKSIEEVQKWRKVVHVDENVKT